MCNFQMYCSTFISVYNAIAFVWMAQNTTDGYGNIGSGNTVVLSGDKLLSETWRHMASLDHNEL